MLQSINSPLISIVMPTYNRVNLIAESIESIQQQTYANWELLIIDDGSDDATAEIITQIPDDRISYYKTQHEGMENARNFGLSKARGELIGFMDSDDLWDVTKLEKQITLFNGNKQIDFCLTGGYEFQKREEPLVYFYTQKKGLKLGDLFTAFFNSEVVAMPQSLLLKRECLDMVTFPQKLELAHIHFILALARSFNGGILYEPLVHRRIHDNNYSSVHQTKRHNDGIQLIRHYKKEIPHFIFVDALLRSHINFGENCLAQKRRWKAMQEFFRAWKYQPLNIIPVKKIAKAILSNSNS